MAQIMSKFHLAFGVAEPFAKAWFARLPGEGLLLSVQK